MFAQWSGPMRTSNFGFIHAAVMFALGVVVGGGLLGGVPRDAQAVARMQSTSSVKATCASNDAVADFVCRNTWLANTRHSYR
jgi:hypothetical protein